MLCGLSVHIANVALRKESVDRNSLASTQAKLFGRSLSARRAWIEIANTAAPLDFSPVALRKESVDRNAHAVNLTGKMSVALRKESVDRNLQIMPLVDLQTPSLSARRAWIEIAGAGIVGNTDVVALRKESVDRNREIVVPAPTIVVALRKESVDRNARLRRSASIWLGRSPQGERG